MYLTITCVAHGMPVEAASRWNTDTSQLHFLEKPQFDENQEIIEIRYELDGADLHCPTPCTPEIDQHDFQVKVYDANGIWLADADTAAS